MGCKKEEFEVKKPTWTAEVQFAGEGTVICDSTPPITSSDPGNLYHGTISFNEDGTGTNNTLTQFQQPTFIWKIDADTLLISAVQTNGVYIYTHYVLDASKSGFDTKYYKTTFFKGENEGDIPCIIDYRESDSYLILKK